MPQVNGEILPDLPESDVTQLWLRVTARVHNDVALFANAIWHHPRWHLRSFQRGLEVSRPDSNCMSCIELRKTLSNCQAFAPIASRDATA